MLHFRSVSCTTIAPFLASPARLSRGADVKDPGSIWVEVFTPADTYVRAGARSNRAPCAPSLPAKGVGNYGWIDMWPRGAAVESVIETCTSTYRGRQLSDVGEDIGLT